MNAVAATSSFDLGILAAFNLPAAPAPAPTGFVNLINALLGPQEPAPVQDAPIALGDSQSAAPRDSQGGAKEPMQVRSPPEIADALIRSMLGSPVTAVNPFNDRPAAPAPVATSKGRQPKEDSQAVVSQAQPATVQAGSILAAAAPPPLVPVAIAPFGAAFIPAAKPAVQSLIPPALIQSAQANPPGGGSKPRSSPATISCELEPAGAKLELAFALRLTPVETDEANAPPATPVAALSAEALSPRASDPLPAVAPVPEAAEIAPVTVQNQIVPTADDSSAPLETDSQSNDNIPSGAPRPALAETKPRPESDQNAEAPPAVSAPAPTSDHGGDFAQPLPSPLPAPAAPRASEQPQLEPIRTAEQALRSSEATPLAESAPKAATAQQIAVRITSQESLAVDLQVTQRAGQVHVTVRTPDAGLQTSLRQDLGTLVNSLERSGYRTDAVTTREVASFTAVATQAAGASFMDARNSGQASGQGSGQNPGQNGRGGAFQDSSPKHQSSQGQPNNFSGGQQQKRRPQPDWIDTLEKAK